MKHEWNENYLNKKGHYIILCSCGKEFKGFDEKTAQESFFKHKAKNKEVS